MTALARTLLAPCVVLCATSPHATTRTAGAAGAGYTTIQAAIDASSNKDESLVFPGTYLGTIDFKGKSLWLHSQQGPAVTTLQGSGTVVTVSQDETSDTVIEGFTITSSGTGIYVGRASPVLQGCTFKNATGTYGLTVREGGTPLPRNLTVTKNKATHAFYIGDVATSVVIEDSTLTHNVSANGGAITIVYGATVEVRRSTFTGNSGTTYGGAIYVSGANLTVSDSTFSGNAIVDYGSALFLDAAAP